MRMQRRQFRIGELAKCLEVERFVVRFWEREFGIAPHRSDGGQRFYEEDDLEKFKLIKSLLYERKFTIAGAKKQLHEHSNQFFASQKTTIDTHQEDASEKKSAHIIKLNQKIHLLRKQLISLQKLL